MYKYEMDPTRIVGTTKRTRDAGRPAGQMDRRTDGRTDGVKPIYPQQIRSARGVMYSYGQVNMSF